MNHKELLAGLKIAIALDEFDVKSADPLGDYPHADTEGLALLVETLAAATDAGYVGEDSIIESMLGAFYLGVRAALFTQNDSPFEARDTVAEIAAEEFGIQEKIQLQ